ncbi:DUF1254 domain-containing protein [uncultured Sphingorhabdus sp.]|uniref:DUF1254 domain-containing protein n=1 Tax=uncultured Sphingorhabdus sp. TaxID=1686106 RepID=UPI002638EB65|nr:DUF1214 domain-containing protein [uncultured Sphingorhabdus sp.]HMS19877.1 DUF1214 domain-containing protein [Sphingorhabdus sp.]
MTLPSEEQCRERALDPEVALAQSIGVQAYIYGFPIVDMLRQKFNETHRVRADQPVAARVNCLAVYPGVLTPSTQGNLRAANSDTLYLNAWVDMSDGPVLLEIPEMGDRYYTLCFMDLYAKPYHLGTRTNGGQAKRYVLIGPSGGEAPAGYQPFHLPTDIAWLLGRVMANGLDDEAEAIRLSNTIVLSGKAGPDVSDADPLQPFESLLFYSMLNKALKTLPRIEGEEGLLAMFDTAGFGPACEFDPDSLSEGQALGLGAALRVGPQILTQRGFKPTRVSNGWMFSSAMGDPGFDYLLRAETARGGYVNAPEESIYPAAVADSSGAFLSGEHRYRIRFEPGKLPPVDAFWSITAYNSATAQLTENPLRRYAIGDRTHGLAYGSDGSLEFILSVEVPPEGRGNWLPIPNSNFHLVARLYLPRAEALDGRYSLPPIERI